MRPRSSARRSSSASALWTIAWNSFRSGASRCRPCGQGAADQGSTHADDGMMLRHSYLDVAAVSACKCYSPACLAPTVLGSAHDEPLTACISAFGGISVFERKRFLQDTPVTANEPRKAHLQFTGLRLAE